LFHAAKEVAVQVSNAPGCGAFNVHNGEVLQTLIASMVSQSLNERLPADVEAAVESKFQAVQQQINDTIDEKIIDSQHDTPGKQ
jgi:hypothetical protein